MTTFKTYSADEINQLLTDNADGVAQLIANTITELDNKAKEGGFKEMSLEDSQAKIFDTLFYAIANKIQTIAPDMAFRSVSNTAKELSIAALNLVASGRKTEQS